MLFICVGIQSNNHVKLIENLIENKGHLIQLYSDWILTKTINKQYCNNLHIFVYTYFAWNIIYIISSGSRNFREGGQQAWNLSSHSQRSSFFMTPLPMGGWRAWPPRPLNPLVIIYGKYGKYRNSYTSNSRHKTQSLEDKEAFLPV